MNVTALGEKCIASLQGDRGGPIHLKHDRPLDDVTEILARVAVSGGRRSGRDLNHRGHALTSCAGNIVALKFGPLCRGLPSAADGDRRQNGRF